MAPSRKVVSTAESSEDHSLQEKIAKMMVMVETSTQQVIAINRVLEEARAEFTVKIAELQQENQYLKEAQKKMQYDPCNPEIKENEIDDEVMEPSKQKTSVARLVDSSHNVDGAARSKHCTPRSNEVKKKDLEDWKAQILAEMMKKIRGYGRFSNPQDLAMMAT